MIHKASGHRRGWTLERQLRLGLIVVDEVERHRQGQIFCLPRNAFVSRVKRRILPSHHVESRPANRNTVEEQLKMPTKPKPNVEATEQTVKIVWADDVPEYYANFVQILTSPWDFLLAFGATKVTPVANAKVGNALGLVAEAEVEVLLRMSPQHAKETASVLQRLVASFEESYGPISTSTKDSEKEESDDVNQPAID